MIHGYKTKIGAIIILIAGAIAHLSLAWAMTVLCVGISIALLGIYDRHNRNTHKTYEELDKQTYTITNDVTDKLEALKSRIKKPMLRS